MQIFIPIRKHLLPHLEKDEEFKTGRELFVAEREAVTQPLRPSNLLL